MLDLLLLPLTLSDPSPEPEDVKAGWTAFAIFLLLAVAVVVLGFSLVKQLRRAQAAQDSGVYGDAPADRGTDPTSGPASGVGPDEPGDRPSRDVQP